MNHHAKYVNSHFIQSTVMTHTHTHTQSTDCSTWTTEVVGN